METVNWTKQVPYTIPEGYFEYLSEQIYSDIQLLNQPNNAILSFGKIASLPLEVPENYWQNFSSSVLSIIQNAENANTLSHIAAPQMNWEIPQNYFETLSTQILQKVQEEVNPEQELNEQSPLLQSLKQQANPFSVPEQYLDTGILDKISKPSTLPEKPKMAVVKSKKVSFKRSVLVAAVLIGILAVFGLPFILPSQTEQPNTYTKLLAQVPDTDIANYLLYNMDEFDILNLDISPEHQQQIEIKSILDNVSIDDIKDYLTIN